MPFLNVKLIEGVFDSTQKEEMITKLTDTMVSIEGENIRGVTWVVIEEVKSGEWGVGGRPLATADVKALRGRRNSRLNHRHTAGSDGVVRADRGRTTPTRCHAGADTRVATVRRRTTPHGAMQSRPPARRTRPVRGPVGRSRTT